MNEIFPSFSTRPDFVYWSAVSFEASCRTTSVRNQCESASVHIATQGIPNDHVAFHHSRNPGVNFINVLWAAFTLRDPKSIKIQSSCQYLFVLLRSAFIETSRKMLMKLTPGCRRFAGARNRTLDSHLHVCILQSAPTGTSVANEASPQDHSLQ